MYRRLINPLQQSVFSISLTFLVAFHVANAQAADPASMQLRHFIKDVQQAKGEFSQKTVTEQQKDQNKQKGTFAFNRQKGQFLWEVNTPYEQLILADGQRLIQYDPDLSQATERELEDAVGSSPAAILFGSRRIDDAFEIQDLKTDDLAQKTQTQKFAWLRATPKSAEAGFQYVDMGFYNSMPQQLIIVDSFGQQSDITLKSIETNIDLPANLFEFQIPDGVDFIKLQ